MAINREEAIYHLSKIKVAGNEEGLIPAFGVLVNQLPTDFWNSFAWKILEKAGEDLYEQASWLLENAAHECGYHTGYGIINSDEFQSVIAPMIEDMPEDVLHGAYAVFTAWGWGKAEIVELVPGEKMVVRAEEYYEADIRHTHDIKHHFAYMMRGVAAGFMDLAYGEAYPNGLGTFQCEQTKGIEVGDAYGEFVVSRAH